MPSVAPRDHTSLAFHRTVPALRVAVEERPRLLPPRAGLVVAAAFALTATISSVGTAGGADCDPTTITAPVVADTWLDENSPFATKGTDSILNVEGGSVNVDTRIPSGRARALLRFSMPTGVPLGCVVESAKLRVYSAEESDGARIDILRLASAWSENVTSWSSQPATTGAAARAWSRQGYIQWNVTSQVAEIMEGAASHGFAMRDAAEGTESAAGHGFYAREKGENPAHLVIRFAPPPSGEPPGPPAPPTASAVSCGQVLSESTLVTNDLSGCLGDGLVIGADRIIVDLGGHTIDGTGLGAGVRNEGYDLITVRNGLVQDFDYGVQLFPETAENTIEGLTLRLNQVAAVELFEVADSVVLGNRLDQNGGGIDLVSGTTRTLASGNVITANGKDAIHIQDSTYNRVEDNDVSGGGDLGIGLVRASENTLLRNTVSANSDGGIEIREESHGNRVEGNTVTQSGDHGILVDLSDRNELIGNTSQRMSDSGITLSDANDGVVRANDVRFNTGGLQVDGSSRNLLEANNASDTLGIGIELGGGSLENHVLGNVADANGAQGIFIADSATDPAGVPIPDLGNVLERNTASGNLADGIVTGKGGHRLTANVARNNRGWGISAAPATIDGGLNVATGNGKAEQCTGIVCRAEWNPPETTITLAPAEETRSSSATFGFTGNDDTNPASALRFECSLDAATFSSCTSGRSFSGLAAGAHEFRVRATDQAGNTDPFPATHTWSIDLTPPDTEITSRPADPSNAANGSLGFVGTDSVTGASALTFECRLDSLADSGWTACATPHAYADLAEGDHRFEVRGIDRAGNVDPSPASYSWTVDVTPPRSTIHDRPDDPTNETSATFTFSADEPASFECTLNAEPAPCDDDGSAAYSGLLDGTHTLTLQATDAAGNIGESVTYTWAVDTTPPRPAIITGADDPTNRTSARFVFGADEPASFACSLDGGEGAPCDGSADYVDLAEGGHTFMVTATDAARNVGEPATYSWTVDLTPPVVTIGDGPDDPTNATSAVFKFGAGEFASFECALDALAAQPCDGSATYAELVEGAHTFSVTATDQAGNVSEAASHSWSVDTTAPVVTLAEQPDNPTDETSATFTFSADEPVSFSCTLDAEPAARCDGTAEYAALAEGEHTFSVTATDQAGNVSEGASHSWSVDTTPPVVTLAERPADPTTATSASFTFSADEPASSSCALDAEPAAACDAGTAEYAGLAEGAHTFSVTATDAAGNPSEATTYTWTIDTTAPVVTINDRPDDPTNATSASFTFSADEPASLSCAFDAGPAIACHGGAAEYSALAEGTHSFTVVATDAAGNEGSAATYTWTIDMTAPVVTLGERPDDMTTETTARFTFSADEPASLSCTLDAGEATPCDGGSAGYGGLAEGEHTFSVTATDATGNASEAVAYTWTIDSTAPVVTIDDRPDDPTNATSATFTFSADEPASLHCILDDATPVSCDGGVVQYAGLADGPHSFAVRATDPTGNVGQQAVYAWRVDTIPPAVAIEDRPADPTSETSARFTFAANELASLGCTLDAGPAAACDSGVAEYGGLVEGEHTFSVTATDTAGNVGEPARYTWTIEVPDEPTDTTAPETAIGEHPPSPTNSTSASFTFTGSDDVSQPSALRFECRLDTADPAAWASCASPKGYIGLAAGVHTFEVRAVDQASNADASPASHTWTIDTTAPQTEIDSGPQVTTQSRSATFTFSGSDDTSPQSALTFECALDGPAFASCSSPASYATLADGSHTFRVRATDAAGNADPEAAIRTWIVDNGSPETALGERPPSPTRQTSATFTFSGTDALSESSALRFECRLNGAAFASCTSPRTDSGLGSGAQTFEVRAIDPAGNVDGSPAAHTWTIDATAPETTITSGPSGTVTSRDATFTFSANESGSTFECALDSTTAYSACTSPRTYTGLAAGSHTFRVRATDTAGNIDGTAAARSWTIQADTTPPQTTIDSGPSGTVTTRDATFTFSSSESGSTFQCSLDSTTAYSACTSPLTYSGLGTGSHTFRVRAVDLAGNVDGTPAARSWTIQADTTAPQTTISSAPSGTVSSTTATFSFTSSESGSTFECALDGATFVTCTSPREYTALSAGTHTFQVRARDAAGNVDQSPATASWTIEPISGCGSALSVTAAADAWLEQNSASNNKGTDSILKVKSQGANDNFRAVVRFNLPSMPKDCVLESATLRLYAPAATTGRTLQAIRLDGEWTEGGVTWANQPAATGPAAETAAGLGNREWVVTPQVGAMYDGANHGFLIRDSAEGASGAEQSFHSREKGENPPVLILRYAAAGN